VARFVCPEHGEVHVRERAAQPGVVVIGRNEGPRLRRCLESLADIAGFVVYVDSGSTDGSVELARGLGAEVVELDRSEPFTAARARNAGFERLMRIAPQTELVQFVDGDCELVAGWIEQAAAALCQWRDVAIVCGRRRERYRDHSPYNRLCDIEWDTPIGETSACGGDFLARAQALQRVGGFNPELIAGEEPELCLRLRRTGWRIVRIDAEMTLHDAQMDRLGQWWRRAVRSGHAYAEGFWRHGMSGDHYELRPLASILLWAAVVPAVAVGFAWPTGGWSVALLLLYPVQWVRICRRRGPLYATFTLLAKWPQLLGAIRFVVGRLFGRRSTIIEYKAAADQTQVGVSSS